MEYTPLVIERSQTDLNQIFNQIMQQLSDNITKSLLDGIKHLLENHKPVLIEQPKEYFNIEETCAKLGVCRTTLHNWKKNNVLIPDAQCGKSPLYSNVLIETYLKQTNKSIDDCVFNNF